MRENKVGSFRDAYRPERHYMRGPGPKWHAKHTNALMTAAGVQPVIDPDAPRRRRGSAQNSLMSWFAPITAATALGFAAVMMLA